jgi:ABC-type nickel/cobalt efflux system permease component RcnA
VRELRDGASVSGLLAFLALALAYGALHAAGPGHGKAVAVSYVLARREGPGRAALLGAIMGAAHAASAVALVLGLYLILERSLMARFTAQGLWLERASYALVCAIALWLLVRAVRGDEEEGARGAADRGLVATGLATGLVPCPGAAIVLLFALALGAPGIGLGAVAAMALGMGATIATAAVLAALCRQRVAALAAPRSPRRTAALDRALSILGALAVLALGVTLLAGSLGRATPTGRIFRCPCRMNLITKINIMREGGRYATRCGCFRPAVQPWPAYPACGLRGGLPGNLRGRGRMPGDRLQFLPPGRSRMRCVHGAFSATACAAIARECGGRRARRSS